MTALDRRAFIAATAASVAAPTALGAKECPTAGMDWITMSLEARNGLTDRASVDTVLHRDGVTRPHRGNRYRDRGRGSGRNDRGRRRRIRLAPP